jgi:hypothetical protein
MYTGGGGKEEEAVKYVSLDLSSLDSPATEIPTLRILEVTEVQDLSSGVRVPDLERFMTVLHPSSGSEASFGSSGRSACLDTLSTNNYGQYWLCLPYLCMYIISLYT